jgi:hypothetical protein
MMQTVLRQGHLRPLPLHAGPIDWAYEHALRLYPAPDLLIIGDRVQRFDMKFGSTLAANPGSFAADFSFYTYTPADRLLQPCQCAVHEVDAMLSERGPRAEDKGKLRRKKSSSSGKRDKEGADKSKRRSADKHDAENDQTADVDAHGNGKSVGARQARPSKKCKTTPLGKEGKTAPQQGIGAFFTEKLKGPLYADGEDYEQYDNESYVSRRDGDGDGDGKTYRKRRVVRQVESDEDGDSDAGEGEGEERHVSQKSKRDVQSDGNGDVLSDGNGDGEEAEAGSRKRKSRRGRVVIESDEEEEEEEEQDEGSEGDESDAEGESETEGEGDAQDGVSEGDGSGEDEDEEDKEQD